MIEILYRDRDLLFAVKPVGMLSESSPDGGETVTERLQKELGVPYVGLVHRLDRVSGGVMLFSLRREVTGKLCESIRTHFYKKEYLAVCTGQPSPSEGEMRDYLFFDRHAGKSFPVTRARRGAKEARLTYRVLETRAEGSLVCVGLETGRTHQIRVQFASRGYPLLGDRKYGSRQVGCTCALWSHTISLAHPLTGEPLTVCAPPPPVFPWNLFAEECSEGNP